MCLAAICGTIVIAQMSGDRPAIITKVFSNRSVEACAFLPEPQALRLVLIHDSRAEAINAGQKDLVGWHAYWPAKG